MSVLPIPIYGPNTIPTIVAALVTIPVNQIWIIKQASMTNVHPSASDHFTMYIGRGGDGAANSNTIYQEEPLSAEDAVNLSLLNNVILNGGDVLRGWSEFGNLTLMINGYRFR